jgi:catechol 2,3-dioxygenase-like lactoylglutathione lyase family enzyme
LDIEAIDHISINCADFTASCEFYGGVLGFERLQTVDCGEFDITYFRLPGGARLELFDYHGRSPLVERAESEGGLRHLAFRVKDVAARERELLTRADLVFRPTCDLPNLGARVLLCLDPHGVTWECCEPL